MTCQPIIQILILSTHDSMSPNSLQTAQAVFNKINIISSSKVNEIRYMVLCPAKLGTKVNDCPLFYWASILVGKKTHFFPDIYLECSKNKYQPFSVGSGGRKSIPYGVLDPPPNLLLWRTLMHAVCANLMVLLLALANLPHPLVFWRIPNRLDWILTELRSLQQEWGGRKHHWSNMQFRVQTRDDTVVVLKL